MLSSLAEHAVHVEANFTALTGPGALITPCPLTFCPQKVVVHYKFNFPNGLEVVSRYIWFY